MGQNCAIFVCDLSKITDKPSRKLLFSFYDLTESRPKAVQARPDFLS